MHQQLRTISAVSLILNVAAAQTSWVVGLTGADFSDIPPAVAAAAAGDTIIVEPPGTGPAYTPTVFRKGIRLVQRTSIIRWDYDVRIADIPTNETFTLVFWQGNYDLEIRDCSGPVIVENSGDQYVFPFLRWPRRGDVSVTNCRFVSFNNCGFVSTVVRGSVFRITGGLHFGDVVRDQAIPALTLIDSTTTLPTTGFSMPTVNRFPGSQPAPVPAISMQGGTLEFGLCGIAGARLCCDPRGYYVESQGIISDGGHVSMDPRATLGGPSPGISGSSTRTTRELDAIRVNMRSITATTSDLEVLSDPGTPVFALMSLATYNPVPTVFGDFWLDPRNGRNLVAAQGVCDWRGIFEVGVQVNRFLQHAGQEVVWQGIALHPTNGIRLTAPTFAATKASQ